LAVTLSVGGGGKGNVLDDRHGMRGLRLVSSCQRRGGRQEREGVYILSSEVVGGEQEKGTGEIYGFLPFVMEKKEVRLLP